MDSGKVRRFWDRVTVANSWTYINQNPEKEENWVTILAFPPVFFNQYMNSEILSEILFITSDPIYLSSSPQLTYCCNSWCIKYHEHLQIKS